MHYHWLSVLSVLSAVLPANLATPPTPLWGDVRMKHTWDTVPANWESLGPPPAGTTINLHIALKPLRDNALIEALDEVSNPQHQKYGAHLSRAQVAELVAPHEDTLAIVRSWLEHHGVPSSSISTSHGGGWLTITDVPVSRADELLCASYQLYRHTGTNGTEAILRTVSYALPEALHAHVQTIAPTTHFASPRALIQTPRKRSSAASEAAVMANATSGEFVRASSKRDDYLVTPSFLRWFYGTNAYEPAATGRNMLGILGFQSEYPNTADLEQFLFKFRDDAITAAFTVVDVNGGGDDSTSTGQMANVITQYAEAITYPTPVIFYSSRGIPQWSSDNFPADGDPYLDWLRYILVQPNIPQTISILYADPEKTYPQEYARALCHLFALLGARGVSVLVASGDHGVGRDCQGKKARFIPMFPASCPWVTSVGGTKGREGEVAVDFSGGGFSFYFQRPPYQDRAMPMYLWFLDKKYAGKYRRDGRGIPDISAQANLFSYIHNTLPAVVSSTGCSTSAAAGVISLLNDYLISNGRYPLGFLNPWLYGLDPTYLNDIVSGSNPGCNTKGFATIRGWDPVTGLGTANFEALLAMLTHNH